MTVDEVYDELPQAVLRLLQDGRNVKQAMACERAREIIRMARYVKINPDDEDSYLIDRLERAAKACDSPLLREAALRLRRHQTT